MTLKVPELPEGWYFDVSKEHAMFTFYRVRLMKPGKFLWFNIPKEVDRSFVLDGYEPEYLQQVMCMLLDRHEERVKYAQTPDLTGQYPPKELKPND